MTSRYQTQRILSLRISYASRANFTHKRIEKEGGKKKNNNNNTYFTNNPLKYAVCTPVFYIWQNPSPHNRKKPCHSKRTNGNPLNAAIKSFELTLNHPFLPATTFATVYRFSHWFPTKRRAPWLLHTKAAFLSAAIDWLTWCSMTNDGAAQ